MRKRNLYNLPTPEEERLNRYDSTIMLTIVGGKIIIYTLFFSLLLTWLFQRSFGERSRWQRLNVLPFGAWLFDLLENACLVTMLSLYPATPAPLAWLATSFTLIKWSFAGVTLFLVLVGLGMAVVKAISSQQSVKSQRRLPTL